MLIEIKKRVVFVDHHIGSSIWYYKKQQIMRDLQYLKPPNTSFGEKKRNLITEPYLIHHIEYWKTNKTVLIYNP